MEARAFLSRAGLLELQVQSKLMQLESLKSLACRVTAVYDAEPVTHSRNPAQMQDVIVRIMEVEEDLNRRIDTLVEMKLSIGLTIDRVQDSLLRLILEKKYLDFMTLDEIGAEIHYSSRWMRVLHHRALEEVQKVLDEQEGEENCPESVPASSS